MPYFSLTYGEKFTAIAKLKRIYFLMSRDDLNSKIECVSLAYSLTSGGQGRKLNLIQKIKMLSQGNTNQINCNISRSETESKLPPLELGANNEKMSILFFLGFILGDGSIFFRIRNSQNIIPLILIKQSATPLNHILFTQILDFLTKFDVKGRISTSSEIVLIIEGKENVCKKILPLLVVYSDYFYWKETRLSVLTKFNKLFLLHTKHWLEAQLIMLKLAHSTLGKSKFPIDY